MGLFAQLPKKKKKLTRFHFTVMYPKSYTNKGAERIIIAIIRYD